MCVSNPPPNNNDVVPFRIITTVEAPGKTTLKNDAQIITTLWVHGKTTLKNDVLREGGYRYFLGLHNNNPKRFPRVSTNSAILVPFLTI